MKQKKVNPRKRPANAADVEKAYVQDVSDGIDYTVILFLNVMRDKFGFGSLRLARVMQAFDRKLEDIADRTVTLAELKQTLKDEADITVDGLNVSIRGVCMEVRKDEAV